MAYDAVRRNVVLFGGKSAEATLLNDTWTWDGASWTSHNPALSPPARVWHTMVDDATRGKVILFGGYSAGAEQNDTWEWDGASWAELSPSSPPPPRRYQAMAYDEARRQVVLFAGQTSGSTYLNDTWTFRFEANLPDEACLGFDSDHDGLVGCADPDCWGYCMPFCPPGTACDPAQLHCGDGVCNPSLESCRLCPADCGACTGVCGDFFCDPDETAATCPGDCP